MVCYTMQWDDGRNDDNAARRPVRRTGSRLNDLQDAP
jgi:hypothetical protein